MIPTVQVLGWSARKEVDRTIAIGGSMHAVCVIIDSGPLKRRSATSW